MAIVDKTIYVNAGNMSSTGYYAITQWSNNGGAGTAFTAGMLRRTSATPSVGNERVWICIIAGTGGTGADPLNTTFTRGNIVTDAGASWQECTGHAPLNGDTANAATWVLSRTWTLGETVYDSGTGSVQICTTAGAGKTSGSPTFSATAGVTAADNVAVWTSCGAASNFGAFAAPFVRLAAAVTSPWSQATTQVRVSDIHAESQGATVTVSTPTSSLFNILCVSNTSVSTVSTGASVTTSGGNFAINISPGGNNGSSVYIYGLTFTAGSGASGTASFILTSQNNLFYLERCTLALASTGSSSSFSLAGTVAASASVTLLNCTLSFNHANQSVSTTGHLYWRNASGVAALAGTAPTTLFAASNGWVFAESLDLSAVTGNLCAPPNLNSAGGETYMIKDCRLGVGVSLGTASSFDGNTVTLIRCDSGSGNYRNEKLDTRGRESTETSITRTSGASDGTTAFSRKIVTSSTASWQCSYGSLPITVWSDTTGAYTVTVEGTWNSGSVPNNDDLWMEVEYLVNSSYPLGSIVTTTKAGLLASNAALTTSASSWNGGGSGAGWSPFKLTASITTAMKGPIQVTIRGGKASSTFYIDPLITLT